MRQPIKKLQKTTGLVGRLFVLFTSSCDPILLSLGAASHAVGVLWNDAATGRNSCFTRVTWVRRTKWANMFFGRFLWALRVWSHRVHWPPLSHKISIPRWVYVHKRFALPPLTPCISFCCPHSTFTDPQSTTDGKFWTGKHFLHFNRRKGKIKIHQLTPLPTFPFSPSTNWNPTHPFI
jgi:hypothetical protein